MSATLAADSRHASSLVASRQVASRTGSGVTGSRAASGSSRTVSHSKRSASSLRQGDLQASSATGIPKKPGSATSAGSPKGSGRGSGLIDRRSGSQVSQILYVALVFKFIYIKLYESY